MDDSYYAAEILRSDRDQLLMKHRYLAGGIHELISSAWDIDGYGTDGRYFLFSEKRLIHDFMRREPETFEIFLHSLLHCLYLHPFLMPDHTGTAPDGKLWDLASDICICDVMGCLGYRSADRSYAESLLWGTGSVHGSVNMRRGGQQDGSSRLGFISVYSVYDTLARKLSTGEITPDRIDRLEEVYRVDDHRLWRCHRCPEKGIEDVTDPDFTDGEMDMSGEGVSFRHMMKRWRDIAGQTMTELDMALLQNMVQGDEAGNMLLSLGKILREDMRYDDFLRQFAVTHERMKPDTDSIDPGLYTYGLELYGDMPIIEPPESREERVIREFVTAIDTSGSCDEALIRRFLALTYDILSESVFDHNRTDLRIIQCDAGIQDEAVIRSRQELDAYMEDLHIRGRGGTDFRPVFDRIEELRQKGELRGPDGLLYFTDGYGTFPVKPVDYRTVFVITGDNDIGFPAWAVKVSFEI